MKIKNKKILLNGGLLLALFVFGFWSVPALNAFEIKSINTPNAGDFIISPAKTEVSLDPGASVVKNLTITNRMGETKTFKIEIEDFEGSKSGSKAVVLLGEAVGPYSLKDYLKPEVMEFTLETKQEITLPITITIPEDGEPGGLYGSILVSIVPDDDEEGGGATIVSRLGALYFVRVNGPVTEEGALVGFQADKAQKVFYEEGGPTGFNLLFENKGNVSLNPYGIINVTNMLGITIDELEVDPYFAMPNSKRQRQIAWSKKLLMGKYTVTAEINRGYGDIVDEKSITFWILPWKLLLSGFAGILLIVLIVRWFFSRFELKKKSKS